MRLLAQSACAVVLGMSWTGCAQSQAVAPPTSDVVRASSVAIAHVPLDEYRPRNGEMSDNSRLWPTTAGVSTIYIGDGGAEASSTGQIDVLNGSYAETRAISANVGGPEGMWVDAHGSLYVANWSGKNIVEYPNGSESGAFVYSNDLNDPVNVTTDKAGDVYALDYNNGQPGYVDRYPPRQNIVSRRYKVLGSPTGAVVDANGNLFVAYVNTSTLRGGIERFTDGRLEGRDVGVLMDYPFQLLLDKKNNLVVTDQLLGRIDVLAPPYHKVSRTFGKFQSPAGLAFNTAGTTLYVSDPGAQKVYVLNYARGDVRAQIGKANGISAPQGVAVYPELQ